MNDAAMIAALTISQIALSIVVIFHLIQHKGGDE